MKKKFLLVFGELSEPCIEFQDFENESEALDYCLVSTAELNFIDFTSTKIVFHEEVSDEVFETWVETGLLPTEIKKKYKESLRKISYL